MAVSLISTASSGSVFISGEKLRPFAMSRPSVVTKRSSAFMVCINTASFGVRPSGTKLRMLKSRPGKSDDRAAPEIPRTVANSSLAVAGDTLWL